VKLEPFDSVQAFYMRVRDFLLEREAQHNLLLGILSSLLADYGNTSDAYLATLEHQGELQGVALRTPPHSLVLSYLKDPAGVAHLVQALAATTLPGVLGPADTALAFAQKWQQITGQPYRLKMALRIYQLERVTPPASAEGRLRLATPEDRPLLKAWFTAFDGETGLGTGDPGKAAQLVNTFLSSSTRDLYLWEVAGTPVAMAGYSGSTPNGIRINAVYTPPEHRKRGYASACVAALSQRLLDSGRRYCFLFTDLANPTSNHIYQTIGYAPVCDVDEYTFTTAT
jgi:predicted GNAT family acetyltransferase